MNFKIFPATITDSGEKIPLIKGWQELATNDIVQIEKWKQEFGSRIKLWGIPTGHVNGIFALDIDVKKVNGVESLQNLGYQVPVTMYQRTISGGYHYLFKTKEGIHYPNTVKGKLGLDTRGDGGWIGYYGLDETPIAEAPDWIWELVKPTKVEAPIGSTNVRVAPDIAAETLRKALDEVRNAPMGESNNTLNIQSYILGQLVASGSLDRALCEDQLLKAATDRGKPLREARATIESGLNGGVTNPLSVAFPEVPPALPFAIPEPPKLPDRWTPSKATLNDLFNFKNLRKPQLFKDWATEDIHLLTADGGTGKSTLMLYMAVCLALGDSFLGFECKQQGKTLFVTGEDSDTKLLAMIGAICKQIGIDKDAEKMQTIIDSIVVKKDADLCLITKEPMTGFLKVNQNALNQVLQAVEDFKPKLIIFDPIASFWGSEAALNDMNKAVSKFMGELQTRSNACVMMINHMGKQSSSTKDMTQMAGRGGTGLPSHSRVVTTLRGVSDQEYLELTGEVAEEGKNAMLCNVGKFTDGSPLLGKPFLIVRQGYLFTRKSLSPQIERQEAEKIGDVEILFKEMQAMTKELSTKQWVAWCSDKYKMSDARTKKALNFLSINGYQGIKVNETANKDEAVGGKVWILE